MARKRQRFYKEEVRGLTYRDGVKITWMPLDKPKTSQEGAPRMPPAVREMSVMIRTRHLAMEEFYRIERDDYDRKELQGRWMPNTGRFNLNIHKERHGGLVN